MTDIKDLNKEVDKLEAAAKKYASKDTVISIGGYEFTPAKLMVAAGIISSALGSLYGAFEVYKDYQNMKDKIAKYVSPDLTEFDKRLEIIEKNQKATTDALQDSANKTADYTRDIKNDLKQDIRRLEGVVENVERSQKQSSREVDQQVREVQAELRRNTRETDQTLKSIQREVDSKIQKAMDNPLSK